MLIKKRVSFDEVRDAFLRENDIWYDKNPWALGAIEAADKQSGHWAQVTLSAEDILGIMLPHHTRCGTEVVPPSCSTVAEAIIKLYALPSSNPCRRKVEDLAHRPQSLIFLSARPINHPEYPEYRPLVERNYEGLIHLDGLHRLIAWGRSGRSGIEAYMATGPERHRMRHDP